MAIAKPHVSDDEEEGSLFGAALRANKAIAFILGVSVPIFEYLSLGVCFNHITIQNLAYAVCYKHEFYIELCSFSSLILHAL